jgi:hypothetical protein
MLKPTNPCPVCGAETALAEIEPHPVHFKFEIHGYLCDRVRTHPNRWLCFARRRFNR